MCSVDTLQDLVETKNIHFFPNTYLNFKTECASLRWLQFLCLLAVGIHAALFYLH